MAEYKCKCGKPATKIIYTDSGLDDFIHACEECSISIREEFDNWDDAKYRQGRSREKYLSNLETMEFVLLSGVVMLLIALIIQIFQK